MAYPLPVLFLLLATITFNTHPVISLRRPHFLSSPPNPCAALPKPFPTVLSDQLTVLINGYSSSRIPLLLSVAAAYSSSPSVAAVLVLWGNPDTPVETLNLLSHNLSLSSSSAPISLLRQPSNSLNLRFLPLPLSLLRTRAVLVCDDDVSVDPKSVEFAFRIWKQNQNRLVGIFARSHDIDLDSRSWIYTVHPDKYSIMLTKFVMLKGEFLYEYSCGGGKEMDEARAVVDRMRNCEDILMNFVVAEEGGGGPVLVGADTVRDWGDARNEAVVVGGEEGVKEVGLSSRRRDHRKRRGECIREFHRILGRMPLKYSYGKVVNSVGEQGLCEKGGKLVFCDQQVW